MPFGNAARASRAYEYGVRFTAGEDLALLALREKVRLWNCLVAVDHDLRERRDALIGAYLTDHPPIDDTPVAAKAARKAAFADAGVKAALAELDREGQERSRLLGHESPLWWCNRDAVRTTWLQHRRDPEPSRFHSARRAEGTLIVRRSGGWTVASLLRGGDRFIGLGAVDPLGWSHSVRAERRRRCRVPLTLRIGSTPDREPIAVELTLFFHRPLPEGGNVQEVRLAATPLADTVRWTAVFVVALPEADAAPEPTAPAGTRAALDLGWRARPAGLRTAVWHDAGRWGELSLPEKDFAAQLGKVDDLRSIRDQHLNVAKAALAAWVKRQPSLPEWLGESTKTLGQWRSQGRLAGLVRRWARQRFEGDADIWPELAAWQAQDRHLWLWQEHLRDQVLHRRRECYRVFAADLARRYREVVLESVDWSKLARQGKELPPLARWHRVVAAPSILEEAIEHAVGREGGIVRRAEPAYTTMLCHVCGSIEAVDGVALYHVCVACREGGVHTRWDIDVNATRNLLANRPAAGKGGGFATDGPEERAGA